LERWRSGRFDPRDPHDNRSVIKYPAPYLGCYVETTFFKLKNEQSELLRPRRSINSRVRSKVRPAQEIAKEHAAQPPDERRS
jgi:hypothetical protein